MLILQINMAVTLVKAAQGYYKRKPLSFLLSLLAYNLMKCSQSRCERMPPGTRQAVRSMKDIMTAMKLLYPNATEKGHPVLEPIATYIERLESTGRRD
jgi:hypothetical protein